MHPMNWGHYPTRHYKGVGMDVDIPLVPAPMAVATMLVGLVLGVMIGHKTAAAHCRMGAMGSHSMMGHGMGTGRNGDWVMRKKAMMRMMAAHHHHGSGSTPCCCGAEGDSASMHEGPEGETQGTA